MSRNRYGNTRVKTTYSFDKSALTYGDNSLPTYGVIPNKNRNLYFPNARLNQQNIPLIPIKNIINPRLPTVYGNKNTFGKIWYPNMYVDLNYNPEIGGYINSNGPIGPYFAQGLGNYPRSMYKQLSFGSPKRYRSPEKKLYDEEPNSYVIFEGEDEHERLIEIVNSNDSKRGDIITYYPNNQSGGVKTTRIIRKPGTNQKIALPWKYLHGEDMFFGKPKLKKKPIKYCLPKEQKFPVNTKKKCSAALSYARYAPEPCKISRCVEKNCKKYPKVGSHSKLVKECKKKK